MGAGAAGGRSIGRPSEVESLLQRAGQRAAEVERQAAADIESLLPSSSRKRKHRRPSPLLRRQRRSSRRERRKRLRGG